MAARTFREKKTSLSFPYVYMTWITGKELEREINNNGDQFRRKKKNENYFAAVRVCCTCKVVFSLIRNKSVLHVQSFFCYKKEIEDAR